MCITLEAAELTDTIVGGWKVGGKSYLAYSNKPQNLSAKRNAMILPFPGVEKHLTLENIVKTDGNLLHDMRSFLGGSLRSHAPKSLTFDGFENRFTDGIYEYVSTDPLELRSRGYGHIAEGYEKVYGENVILLACMFSNMDVETPPDLLVQYETTDDRMDFFMPLLDSHDGTFPDLDKEFDGYHQHVIIGLPTKPIGGKFVDVDDFVSQHQKYGKIREHMPKHYFMLTPTQINNGVKSDRGKVVQRDFAVRITEGNAEVHLYQDL